MSESEARRLLREAREFVILVASIKQVIDERFFCQFCGEEDGSDHVEMEPEEGEPMPCPAGAAIVLQPQIDTYLATPAPAADDDAEALAVALEGLLAGGRHEGLCDPPDAKGGCRIHLHNSWEREAAAKEAVRIYRAAHPKAGAS